MATVNKKYKHELVEVEKLSSGAPVLVEHGGERVFGVTSLVGRHWSGGSYVHLYRWKDKQMAQNPIEVRVPSQSKIMVLTGRAGTTLKTKIRELIFSNATYRSKLMPNWPGLTLGADPEVFLEKKDGTVLPAFEVFGPKGKSNGQTVYTPYWDGYQAEFQAYSGGCLDGFVGSVLSGLQAVDAKAKQHDAKISLKTVVEVDPVELQKVKQEYAALACGASQNAYGKRGKEIPNPRAINLRFAGGHMHFGNTLSREVYPRIVRALDRGVAIPSLVMFEGMEDPRRRTYYGLAGEYRTPAHGLEYRSLGPGWLAHPGVLQLVWDYARVVYKFGLNNQQDIFSISDEETQEIVNSGDVTAAKKFMDAHQDVIKGILGIAYKQTGAPVKVGWNVMRNGVGVVLKDPMNVEGNWRLSDVSGGSYGSPHFRRWSELAYHCSNGTRI